MLGRTAVLHNLAVLVTSQTITRVRTGLGALLLPALTSTEWTAGIATQLVLFRDWPPSRDSQQDEERPTELRYAGVIKVNGALAAEEGRFETVIPFTVDAGGLRELDVPAEKLAVPILSSPVKGTKRSFVEVADSEDEGESLLTEGGEDEDAFGWTEAVEGLAGNLLDNEAESRQGNTSDGEKQVT